MKVLYTTNIPVPYRIDFFNELGKYCDLTVLFERSKVNHRNAEWLSTSFKNFNGIFLNQEEDEKFVNLPLKVLKYISDNKYDAIVIGVYHTPVAMVAIQYLKMKKIPYYISSDGGFIKPDSWLKRKIKSHFMCGAIGYFSPGNVTDQYLVHYGAEKKKIVHYPFTSLHKKDVLKFPISKEDKKNIKQQLGIREQKMILGVGQFIPRKGWDILLRACQKLDKSIGVYVIGGHPEEVYLEMQREMNLTNVHFLDFMKKDELAKYYKAADLFVLPTREDIWGLVINEAMAYGLPVITTDRCVAGLELIDNGNNGYLISLNSENLISAICNILYDKTLTEHISNLNLQKIRQYTIENMVQVYKKEIGI